MVSSIRRVLLVMMAAVIGLAGCDTSSPSSTGGAGANAVSALTLEQAEQVAETFLKAWEKADYTTMYGLISPNTRDAYRRELNFPKNTINAATQITLSTLETNITSSLRQGTTAIIQYDVTFSLGVVR